MNFIFKSYDTTLHAAFIIYFFGGGVSFDA